MFGCGVKNEEDNYDLAFEDKHNRAYWRFYHVIQEYDEDTETAEYVPYYSELTQVEKDTLINVLNFYPIPYLITSDSVIYIEKSLRGVQNYNAMYSVDRELRKRIRWEEWETIKESM